MSGGDVRRIDSVYALLGIRKPQEGEFLVGCPEVHPSLPAWGCQGYIGLAGAQSRGSLAKKGGGGMKTEYFGAFSKTAIVLVGLFFAVAWAFGDESESLKIDQQLHGVLSDQQMAWNRGDIGQFMEAYWHHESLTFSSGANTTRGWQATLDRYKSKYPDRATMGTLSFEALETVRLDENAAMTLGNWKLDRENPVRGNFSLVWKKIDGQWKIVHDHSSLLADSGS